MSTLILDIRFYCFHFTCGAVALFWVDNDQMIGIYHCYERAVEVSETLLCYDEHGEIFMPDGTTHIPF